MKRNLLYSGTLLWLFINAVLILPGCDLKRSSGFTDMRNVDFNQEWMFIRSDIQGAQNPDFNDSEWRELDLPHDWSVEDLPIQDTAHVGPFYKELERGDDVGYLRGGTGWYRKKITLKDEEEGKQVILHFDGVQSEMILWVNGHEVGQHVYGYTPFYFDITSFLNPAGVSNQIAVQVINPEQNSRWFNGAGIYRDVTLSILNPLHVDVWGLAITTPHIVNEEALVALDLKFCNKDSSDAQFSLVAEIFSPEGNLVISVDKEGKLNPDAITRMELELRVENPTMWDLENPALYSARISLFQAGRQVDEYNSTFGFRTIEYGVDDGFLLNGQEVLMKGACMHHDNGLLGSSAFQRAEERRVRIMKENGYNAIRTSHNPPSKHFLDACDRLGMLVIDESFDMWIQPKRPNDYHLHFEQWWQKDLESMLLRDRNHPSVVMWSFGNEVQERANPDGVAIAAKMIAYIKSVDPTRPITQAVCGFWDNPGKEWDESAPAFEPLDIGGYNYQWANYESDHAKYPGRIMYGSESVPKEAYENWQLVKEQSYVIGDFVWTGMDYLGESGIGHTNYVTDPSARGNFLMPWPWYISWCGDIDIIGNKKPQSWYRDVVWDRSHLEILVHEPVPEGIQEVVSFWGWPKEEKRWNWEGHEGKSLQVHVYSSYPEVRLELNDSIVGQQTLAEDARLTATFMVPYEPGEIKAIGMENGEERESKVIRTTGQVSRLQLIPERTNIDANLNELVFIRVQGVDTDNQVVPHASTGLTVEITGEGELLAAGNACPEAQGSLQDEAFQLFRGEALVIVRSTGDAGSISIRVASETPDSQTQTTITVR